MAEQELPLDVGEEEKKGSSKMLIIVILLLVLILGGGTAAFFLMGSDEKEENIEVVEDSYAPPIYMPLRPSFVVPYSNTGKTRYLQVEITLVGRGQVAMDALADHEPLIKSTLNSIFSAQDFEELRTPDGKENMREQALEELQNLLAEELGDSTIDRILFTSFILQ